MASNKPGENAGGLLIVFKSLGFVFLWILIGRLATKAPESIRALIGGALIGALAGLGLCLILHAEVVPGIFAGIVGGLGLSFGLNTVADWLSSL